MQIGIISDIHDNISNLRKALVMLKDVSVLLCCGDLCSPFIVDELGKGFAGGDIHVVFGNNDGDLFRLTTKAANYSHLYLHGELCDIELGGQRVAMNHFDEIARAIAGSTVYDVVCFGHNHQLELTQVGGTLLINPGEVFGGLTGRATCARYDTDSRQAHHLEIA